MRRRLDEAATAMGGRLTGAADGSARWDGAAFDSRRLQGGELFFALPGEHTDGHRFVGQALEAGAAAAVVHQDVDVAAEAALIRVDDTFAALHALVSELRAEGAPPRVVAITGSVGKTTAKDLLAGMLARRFRVAKNAGNLNNLYGYPLSVLRVPDDTEWMVAEMGMSTPGELAKLSRLSRPDAVVYTCVRPVHLEFFADLRAIAEAKAELLEALVPGGLVVANADDAEVVRFVERHAAERLDQPSRIVWYGRGPGLSGTGVEVGLADLLPAADGPGSRFTLLAGGDRAPARLPLHGDYNVDNALAAAATAWALGVPLAEVAAAMEEARPADRRGIVHRRGDTVIVDDTYNSNPDALERALAAAAELGEADRRWAVLGDMLELGSGATRFHREAGRRAAELGFSPVAGVGELAAELAAAAREEGAEAPWFESAAAAADWAEQELAAGDLVLVKGSRGVGLDVVVERLLARREAA